MTPSELSAIRVECATARGYDMLSTCDIGLGPQLVADVCPDQEEFAPQIVPNYPEDANAALTLAKALADEGWKIVYSGIGNHACVVFHRAVTETATGEATGEHAFELALCQAYLAVHRSKKA